ncbi:MAG: formylglycine-generating enzyme family protein, partial [Proteobacteria bacterium]|nr:formylglycine-generating enzyme family protein [Pseudomonadota bacterium]
EINDGYFELAYQSVLNKNYDQAEQFAESVTTVRHKVALVNDRLLKYLANNSEMTVSLLLGSLSEQVRQAVANHNRKGAQRLIDLTDVLMPDHRIITELNELLLNMPESGQVVTDRMGVATVLISPPSGHAINYGFYVTPTEVTVSQYQAFRQATDRQIQKCQSRLQSNLIFSGRNLDKVGFPLEQNMPVVCVTWQDAVDYAKWLSEQTGHTYRLPTAAEWRLLKQLTATPQTCGSNNVAGTEFPDKKEDVIYHECDDGYPQLAPVRAFTASDLGVYGIYGNASEWLNGCEKPGKLKAFFGSDKPCDQNPVAGLSWLSDRQATDDIQDIDYGDAFTHIGFRLIRQ